MLEMRKRITYDFDQFNSRFVRRKWLEIKKMRKVFHLIFMKMDLFLSGENSSRIIGWNILLGYLTNFYRDSQ